MKALKEKRISLRSLWRRGLVILSLFALVFASCGDSSSSGGDESGGGRKVLDIVWPEKEGLTAVQYFGQEVDLTGLEITVRYADSAQTVKVPYKGNESRFSVYPRVVTGLYDNTVATATGESIQKIGEFTGMPNARVYYDAGGGNIFCADLRFNDANGNQRAPIGIRRENSTTDTLDPLVPPNNNQTDVFAGGLHLVGDLAKDYAFVDDDTFDFTGLQLWADYDDGSQMPVKFENVAWTIVPDYNRDGKGLPRNDDEDRTYRGYVYVTVGYDVTKWLGGQYRYWDNTLNNGRGGWVVTPDRPSNDNLYSSYTPGTPEAKDPYNDKWAGGITVKKVIPKVYTVYSPDKGIEWVQTPVLEDYFFWMEDTSKAWTQRLIDANAAIKVHYRGTSETKTFTIEELDRTDIYWNLNPANSGDEDRGVGTLKAFYPFNKASLKAKGSPELTVNYRGGVITLPVDVYSDYRGVTVATKSGQNIGLDKDDPDPGEDNDVEAPSGSDELAFSKEITVTAVYRAYNDTTKQKEYELKLWPSKFVSGVGKTTDSKGGYEYANTPYVIGTPPAPAFDPDTNNWSNSLTYPYFYDSSARYPITPCDANDFTGLLNAKKISNDEWKFYSENPHPQFGPYYTTTFVAAQGEVQIKALTKNADGKTDFVKKWPQKGTVYINYRTDSQIIEGIRTELTTDQIYGERTWAKKVEVGVNKKAKVSWTK